MKKYYPEGTIIKTPLNREAFSSLSQIKDAIQKETVLEARVILCDKDHTLHLDLNCMEGIMPREEGAIGIREGLVRDIALISRVGKPVCFVITGMVKNGEGKWQALLSRRKAQEKCREDYISQLKPGDVIDARVSHIDNFGVFCDIGAGISALLPIDAVSVSRIPDPNVRFFNGEAVRVIVKGRDVYGRLLLTHKELLGTWQENANAFAVGQTVPGIIRSVENYGIFVELTPNLAGLAEYDSLAFPGQNAAVYIKSILPERMKIKLVIVDRHFDGVLPDKIRYYFTGEHMDYFRYSPENCEKVIETRFG